jgi:hypothetical protein
MGWSPPSSIRIVEDSNAAVFISMRKIVDPRGAAYDKRQTGKRGQATTVAKTSERLNTIPHKLSAEDQIKKNQKFWDPQAEGMLGKMLDRSKKRHQGERVKEKTGKPVKSVSS